MATSKKSTGPEWNDLPLFAEGTPASLSQQQVIAKVKKILVTCGLGYDKPLANYDPTTQSWKMSAGIFPSGEQPSLPILPPSGMTQNGALFQQPAWEPIIGETASSLWPTPTAHPDNSNVNGKFKNPTLGDAVRMWPTPTATVRPMEGNVRLYRAKVEAGEMTEEEATAILGKSPFEAQGKIPAMWPTPRSSSAMADDMATTQRRLEKIGYKARLEEAVAMWPTPTYGKLAGGSGAFQQVQDLYLEGKISDEERKAMQAGNGGKLNPTWVEWLMGFPPGWTDLED